MILFLLNLKKINYLNNLLPMIMSQILSSNFHIRTYVEATLIKLDNLLNQPHSIVNNGLNSPGITDNDQVKILKKQIQSIIGPTLKE